MEEEELSVSRFEGAEDRAVEDGEEGEEGRVKRFFGLLWIHFLLFSLVSERRYGR